MRSLALAALTMVTAFGAGAADAQRIGGGGRPYPGASYPAPMPPPPGGGAPLGPPPPPPAMQHPPMRPYPGQPYSGQNGGPNGGARWGGAAGGHWSGGSSAPGGWNAYRRPARGHRLPDYWVGPSFYIGDYAGYGLSAPPQGYSWHRYYDDAVLIDGRGRVWDSVDGVDWEGGYGYDPAPERGGYPLPPVVRNGGVTTYSTGGGYYAGGFYYPGATTTVVTIQSAPSVTTTTTEYVETTRTRTRYVAPRRVYHAPKRHYRPRTCRCTVERPIQGS